MIARLTIFRNAFAFFLALLFLKKINLFLFFSLFFEFIIQRTSRDTNTTRKGSSTKVTKTIFIIPPGSLFLNRGAFSPLRHQRATTPTAPLI
jgi:hypothetical protein